MPAKFPANNSPLPLLRSLADRGDKVAQTLIDIMIGTYWIDASGGTEATDTIRVSGQIRDQESLPLAGAKEVLVRVRAPLKAPLVDVTAASAAALPACTAAGTGVGKTLTGNANGALTIDGVTITNGMRVLIKDQVAGADNGIYTQTQLGTGGAPFILTRATDFDTAGEALQGSQARVTAGTVNAGRTFVHTTLGAITMETTALTFADRDGGTIGGVTIGTKGTLKSGGTSREAWITTDANGQFEADVKSTLVGAHLVEAVCDNGETELNVITFA